LFAAPNGNNALIRNNLITWSSPFGVKARSAHIEANTISYPEGGGGGLVLQITSGTVLGNLLRGMQAGANVGYGNNTFTGVTPPSGGVELHPNVCNGGPCP
jgi:hypothetical protein